MKRPYIYIVISIIAFIAVYYIDVPYKGIIQLLLILVMAIFSGKLLKRKG